MASSSADVDGDVAFFSPSQIGIHTIVSEAKLLRDVFLDEKRDEARRKIFDRGGLSAKLEAQSVCDVSLAAESLEKISPCELQKMSRVDKPGIHTTWVPMHGYNKVKKLEEPFMPYFGDESLQKAQKLYEAMCKDFSSESAFALPSDGEFEDSNSTSKRKSRLRELSNDLESLRKREAERYAILTTVGRHGGSKDVFKALSKALDIGDVHRVRAVHEVAQKRKLEVERRRRQRRERDAMTDEIMQAIKSPEPVTEYPPPFARGSRTTVDSFGHSPAASKYFCFVCWIFACGVHDYQENVEPIEPIPDLSTDNRMEELRNKTARPCSQRCCLLEDWEQAPPDVHENDDWSAEEEWLLREAVPIFRNDPCNLALTIGSRSCRAVKTKVEPPEFQRWIEENVRASARTRRWEPSAYYKGELKKAQKVLAAEKQRESKHKRKANGKKSGRARKTTNATNASKEPELVSEHPRFVPCDHPGPCVEGQKNCTCVLKNTHCQSRCACNGARLTETPSGKIEWKGKDCGRGARGCSCKEGNCLGEKCVCAGDLVACNPDICTCDCQTLQWDPRARKCRNVDAVYPNHKKTFVGESKYNLGLFAGEYFAKGDLVGVYYGNLLGEELIEKAILVGQEMNNTYALDLTDDLTIDALHMGSKVKFVNHANSAEEGSNCECKFVSIRGNPHALLRTTRAVKPGEEFFFDYKLTHSEGNDWLWNANAKKSSGAASK